jgi:two-component system, OmpR family, phosphate regulon sensor histidine kinase PhoR
MTVVLLLVIAAILAWAVIAQRRAGAAAKEAAALSLANRDLRARAESDLKSERTHFESMLEELPAGVIIINPAGKITFANAAAEKLLVTKKRDLKKAPLSRFTVDFALSKQVAEALRGTQVVKELKVKKPQEMILRAWIRPFLVDGKVTEAVAVLEDVTRLRRLEDMRRELVSSFSHELRTPIASNQATLEALLDMGGDSDPAVRRRFLNNLRTQTEHLSNLVTEMLQLTQLESGAAIADLEPNDAATLAKDALEAVTVLAEAKGIRLEESLQADVTVKADRRLFIQALINLLDNAIKYTDAGGLVSLTAVPKGKRVVFTV